MFSNKLAFKDNVLFVLNVLTQINGFQMKSLFTLKLEFSS